MPVNLNQYRGTVRVFNNRNIAICNFCNIWYSQSFRNCSTFIFFNAIFICLGYLFTLQKCLKSSFLSSLRVKCRAIHTCLNLVLYITILLLYANRFWLDNQGPKPSSNQNFCICHWNLSSISAHNYIKVSLLRAYISTHKFYFICISETYLDSNTSDDDANLKIAGYNLIGADHPCNTKWCLYLLQTLTCFKIIKYSLLEGVHEL